MLLPQTGVAPVPLLGRLFIFIVLSLPAVHAAPAAPVGSTLFETNEGENFGAALFPVQIGSGHRQRRLDQIAEDYDVYVNFTEVLDLSTAESSMAADLIQQVRAYLNSTTEDDEKGEEDSSSSLAVNELLRGFLKEGSNENANGENSSYLGFTIDGGFALELGAGGATAVNVTKVKVRGLDTFYLLDALRPTVPDISDSSNETTLEEADENDEFDENSSSIIQNSFALDELVLELEYTETTGDTTMEGLVVALPFEQAVFTSVPIRLDLGFDRLQQFPLGALLPHDNNGFYFLMPCLRSVVDHMEILEMEVEFGAIGMPVLLEEEEIASPFYNLLVTLFVGLPAAVPIFFDSTVRGLLNDVIWENMVEAKEDTEIACPYASTINDDIEDNLVDFRTFFASGLPAMLKNLINDQLLTVSDDASDADSALLKINEVLIEPMIETMGGGTSATNYSMTFGSIDDSDDEISNGLVDVNTTIALGGLDANVRMVVSDLVIENINTMKAPMELLESLADKPHEIHNLMTMGLGKEEGDRPARVSARIFFSVQTSNGGIEHDVTIQLGMETLSIALDALLKVVGPKLYGFPFRDITNLQCWLATIQTPLVDADDSNRNPTAGIAQLEAALERLNLSVDCNQLSDDNPSRLDTGRCNSLKMEEWTTQLLPTPEAQKEATETMNSILEFATSILSGDALQVPIDRMLNEAASQCPHSPEYDPNYESISSNDAVEPIPPYEYSVEYLVLWGSVALGLVVIVGLVGFVVMFVVRRRHKKWLEKCSEEQRFALEEQHAIDDAIERRLNSATRSMFSSPEIPVWVRWGMPIIILGNIALFLSGHLNLGATVNIELIFAGETIRVDDFFTFSIARSTIDIWKAGGKELAILILIFSGIWPYTKQILTLGLWFVPTRWLSVSNRGSALLWIDRLAKWSMIDIFVIVVCIAAFRVTISSPEVGFLPEGFYSVDLLVVPLWGLYSNMTAQLVSQVSSHFIIHYHRRIVEKATATLEAHDNSLPAIPKEGEQTSHAVEDESDSDQELLRTRQFSRPHRDSRETLIVRDWVAPAMLIFTILTSILVITGCFLPSFSLEILGMIGIAVESGKEFQPAITNHSVFSIVSLLFDEAKFLDTTSGYIGITILCCLFLGTVLLSPILQSIGLLYQWFVPLGRKKRSRLSILNEILQAWQYIEVYIIALFVASWQLGPVSEYMFNVYCGSLEGFFAQLVQYGLIEETDAQCFSVQGSLEPGSLTLVLAAVWLALLNSFVTKATRQCDFEQKRATYNHNAVAIEQASSPNSPAEASVEKLKIRHLPVLFTDSYRWLLRGSSNEGEPNKLPSESVLVDPEATEAGADVEP
mmetsp:Transcript_5858/g.16690  ORF Transcript_5858/g.16690 Transcript_5858/m.16690 type:complete len:1343 (-) Transcript_5858:136-4164(-)